MYFGESMVYAATSDDLIDWTPVEFNAMENRCAVLDAHLRWKRSEPLPGLNAGSRHVSVKHWGADLRSTRIGRQKIRRTLIWIVPGRRPALGRLWHNSPPARYGTGGQRVIEARWEIIYRRRVAVLHLDACGVCRRAVAFGHY